VTESELELAREFAGRPSVFIVGAQRSGTTWLQRMLLHDSRIAGGQESHFFVTFGRVLQDFSAKSSGERPHGLACYWRRAEFVDEILRLWYRTMGPVAGDASWLLEKTPNHALCVELISELLPGSRFIHLTRDPRAVVASLLHASRQGWGRGWAPADASAAARRWVQFTESAHRAGGKLPEDRFLEMSYESLAADPAAALGHVYAFLDLAIPAEDLAVAVETNRFGSQKASGGTPFRLAGELAGDSAPEPPGFFRSGDPSAWKDDLNWIQRAQVWRVTRDLMRELGY
jgi:hypothetical protein